MLGKPYMTNCEFHTIDMLTGKLQSEKFIDTIPYNNCIQGFISLKSNIQNISYFNKSLNFTFVPQTLWIKSEKLTTTINHYPISDFYCVYYKKNLYILNYKAMCFTDTLFDTYIMCCPMKNTESSFFGTKINKVLSFINYQLYESVGGFTFFENGKLKNINEYISLLDEKKFTITTYGNNNLRYIGDDVRTSLSYQENIILDLDIKIPNIKFDDTYELIKYNAGGHFIPHIDRKRYPEHNLSILLYPPVSNFTEGGELVLYPFESSDISVQIKLSKTNWICVIFPIDILHESKPVISGHKVVIKGTGIYKK